jgi:hypothetical protein
MTGSKLMRLIELSFLILLPLTLGARECEKDVDLGDNLPVAGSAGRKPAGTGGRVSRDGGTHNCGGSNPCGPGQVCCNESCVPCFFLPPFRCTEQQVCENLKKCDKEFCEYYEIGPNACGEDDDCRRRDSKGQCVESYCPYSQYYNVPSDRP